jgi:hypothetical protein
MAGLAVRIASDGGGRPAARGITSGDGSFRLAVTGTGPFSLQVGEPGVRGDVEPEAPVVVLVPELLVYPIVPGAPPDLLPGAAPGVRVEADEVTMLVPRVAWPAPDGAGPDALPRWSPPWIGATVP